MIIKLGEKRTWCNNNPSFLCAGGVLPLHLKNVFHYGVMLGNILGVIRVTTMESTWRSDWKIGKYFYLENLNL